VHEHTCDGASAIDTASLQHELVKIKKKNTPPQQCVYTATKKKIGQLYPFGFHAKSERQALLSHILAKQP